jgi:hypothetical protein
MSLVICRLFPPIEDTIYRISVCCKYVQAITYFQLEMEHWIQMVSQGTGAEGTSTKPSKSQTLPARIEGEKKEEHKN